LPQGLPADIAVLTLPTPFPVGDVNCYLIKGDVPTLVDTGPATAEARQALEEGLHREGLSLSDLRQVVITHAHVDHYGQAAMLQDAGATLLAHPHATEPVAEPESYRQWRRAFYERFYREAGLGREATVLAGRYDLMTRRWARPARVDRQVDDGQEIVAGNSSWQVLYLPGHSVTQIGLYRERDRVLVAGDHLLAHISSNAFIEPVPGSPDRPQSLLTYRLALMRLLTLDVDVVLPGHGRRVVDHVELVKRRLGFHEERAALIHRLIQSHPATAAALAAEVFPHLKPDAVALAISEIVGHLDLLVERGLVSATPAGDAVMYHATRDERGGMPGQTHHDEAAF